MSLYFFDKYLNQKINIKVIDRNNFFSSINEIYTISHLKKNYIIDIIIDFHSIILYPFEHNGRYYLYLSNSGLGISNQNTNIKNNPISPLDDEKIDPEEKLMLNQTSELNF